MTDVSTRLMRCAHEGSMIVIKHHLVYILIETYISPIPNFEQQFE